MSVLKVDPDGASCQEVVCHVNRFLVLLLLPLPGRPAHASPAALGAARGLVQRPAHQDAAVQEHLLRWGHSTGSGHSPGDHWHCCLCATACPWHMARVQPRRPQPERPLRLFPRVPSPESLAEVSEATVGRQGIEGGK